MKPVVYAAMLCLSVIMLQSSSLNRINADEKPKVNRTRFYIASPEGKDPKQYYVSEDYYNTGSPTFSPDGSKLAHDCWKSQEGETFSNVKIMVANADGSDPKIIGAGAMPSFSPGGNRIVFSQPSPSGVAIMNADGSNRTLIESGAWGAQWSPDGKKIAYRAYTSGKANLRIYDLIEDTRFDVFPEGKSPYSVISWNMAWSPDSQWLCFKGCKAEDRSFDVATINIAGKQAGYKVHYHHETAPYADFAWHPVGEVIVFCPQTKPRQLLQFNPADANAPEPVDINFEGYLNGDVSFTPDGGQLLFNLKHTK